MGCDHINDVNELTIVMARPFVHVKCKKRQFENGSPNTNSIFHVRRAQRRQDMSVLPSHGAVIALPMMLVHSNANSHEKRGYFPCEDGT